MKKFLLAGTVSFMIIPFSAQADEHLNCIVKFRMVHTSAPACANPGHCTGEEIGARETKDQNAAMRACGVHPPK